MTIREVTPDTVAHLARMGGFALPRDRIEKRARQLARLVDEAERLRELRLGVTAPAVPWIAPGEE